MVQVLVVRVDIGVDTYEAMTPQCGRSVVQVLVDRVDKGVVIYEAMTPQSERSVAQVLVVRVDIGVVIYEAMTPLSERSVAQVLVVRGHRSGDLRCHDLSVGSQGRCRIGDLRFELFVFKNKIKSNYLIIIKLSDFISNDSSRV